MEEFAGVSGVWTTGGCQEESAGAVEVVIFSFFFFFVFFFFSWMGMGMGTGFVGEGETTFSVFIREGGREGGVGGGVFWGGRKGVVDIYPFE